MPVEPQILAKSQGRADVSEPLTILKELLSGLAGQTGKMSAFGHLGRTHLPQRKAGEGIALAATVKDFKSAGTVFECMLDASAAGGEPIEVTLVSSGNPQDFCQIGDQLLIAGRIVDEPQKNIAGYEGEAQRVVMLGEIAKVPKAE